ncbi:MAG: glycosyltransferase family 4 protein [Candidatus Moranbacteria bacterium]|jgi:glycosyltransferase involved in cell wall biosynthesis|nr:glycosyltransferase family 4 protein [Candidatus Moranbacteria bacterium]MDD5651858.1 glycosyltransferase family 4 protein [Candidatus Moranbacteria bacterium]MDX9855892.1 glycosyltransferase family 4 protein [Candidatus Moranbacteria bacterium]
MKKILYVSRPIAPPWDEASKNFAYNLAKEIASKNPSPPTPLPKREGDSSGFEIHMMTKGKLEGLPKNIIQEDIYTSSEKDFRFLQKIRLFWFLFRNAKNFDIIHLFFTPTKFNSFVLKRMLKPSSFRKGGDGGGFENNNKPGNSQKNENLSNSPQPPFSKGGGVKIVQTIATLREDLFSEKELKKMIFGDIIATYSEYAKNKLEGLGFKNTVKIYPGIDIKDYQPKEKSGSLLKKYGFSKDDFIINFTGEYVRLGAMDDIINSFIEVSQKVPNARLSLAVRIKNEKDAKKKEEVIKKLEENGLLEKVSFHDDGKYAMSDIYNLCDISLFPVRNMQGKFDVPLAVIEAMACAKPVVISDIPILKEFSNKENSIRVRAGNVGDITDAILTLYNDEERRKYVRTYARTYVEENFSLEKAAKKYSETYNNL